MSGPAHWRTGATARITTALLALLATGCAVVGVKVDQASPAALRREALHAATAQGDTVAAASLARAQVAGLPEAGRAKALLDAAEGTASAEPGSAAHAVNLAATRGLLALMAARDHAPLPLGDGRTLGTSPDGSRTLDPRTADAIIPAADIRISKLPARTTRTGAGLPCVAHFAPDSPALRDEPGIPPLAGICEPVTVLVRPGGNNPRLDFIRTRVDDVAAVGNRTVELATDFSSPLAYMLSRGRNRDLDILALLRVDARMGDTGLYQFSRFDPDRIPVVFVHGLLSRPETWAATVNGLLADKDIRERYQFWFFLYPTGLPVWNSAAELRSELERFRDRVDPARRNRNLDRMVLVGHSMGGLVSSLQVRSGGEAFWRQFMDTPPSNLDFSPAAKARILEIVDFQPRTEVARVVFFSTPHRGSEMALKRYTRFFSRVIRLPFQYLEADRALLRSALRREFRGIFTAPANSLVFLRANSPLLKSILNLPMKQGLPYHSVIGDRGRGDTPDSSDGVVGYWSARLEGAVSETIVPSDHSSHSHPEGIAELARILRGHHRGIPRSACDTRPPIR